MCGILGSPYFTPQVRAMLPYLAIGMEHRGHHSWGASDGVTIIKNLGLITRTWAKEISTINGWDQGIFHTRAASPGYSPTEVNNAHPFRFTKADGTDVIGIHNGALSNHQELNRLYGRSCTVDSQHLWMHRAEGRPWTELRGAGIMAWWETLPDHGPDPVLMITKINGQALEIIQTDDGGFVFASEMGALQMAIAMAGGTIKTIYRTEPNRVYLLAEDAIYKTDETLHFGFMPVNQQYQIPGTASTVSTTHGGNPQCTKCGNSVSDKEHLYCIRCFKELLAAYEVWYAATGGLDVLDSDAGGPDVDSEDVSPIVRAVDLQAGEEQPKTTSTCAC